MNYLQTDSNIVSPSPSQEPIKLELMLFPEGLILCEVLTSIPRVFFFLILKKFGADTTSELQRKTPVSQLRTEILQTRQRQGSIKQAYSHQQPPSAPYSQPQTLVQNIIWGLCSHSTAAILLQPLLFALRSEQVALAMSFKILKPAFHGRTPDEAAEPIPG